MRIIKGGVIIQLYYSTKEISDILGCSPNCARRIMQSMPHLRITRSKGSIIRVKIEDFDRYIQEHTIQPDEFQPRISPFPTIEAQTKAWHRGKHK